MEYTADMIERMEMAEGLRLLREAEEAQIAAAKEDINAFIEYVGVDTRPEAKRSDGSSPAMVQSDWHVQFQQLIDEHPRFIAQTIPGLGKTTQLVYRAVYEIGKNPDIRIVIVSLSRQADSTGAKIAQQIRNLIQFDERVKKVFPKLHRGDKWEQTRFRVRRSSYGEKDYTVQIAAPPYFVQGSRVDMFIFDDFYDARSVASESDRKKLMKWFYTMLERLTPDGRVVFACNPFHPRDPAHMLERETMMRPRESPWRVYRFPVYTPAIYDADLSTVKLTLPEFYPIERIEKIRNTLPAAEFVRGYLCKATDEAESPFDQEKVRRLFRPEHDPEGGEGGPEIPRITLREQRAQGCVVVLGVDLAARKHSKADMTAIAVVVVWPTDHVYQLVWLESGRWRADEIGRKLIDLDRKFRPMLVMVENNGAQDYIFSVIQLLIEKERLEVRPGTPVPMPPLARFTTGKNKADPVNGIEGISAEIVSDTWIVPAIQRERPGRCHGPLTMLLDEITSYNRNAHTGDHLMALWFAREAARTVMAAEEDERDEAWDEMESLEWGAHAEDDDDDEPVVHDEPPSAGAGLAPFG